MKFFLVDDDDSIRAILANIIEDEDLGVIKGEAIDGSEISANILKRKEVDILVIDLLMPNRDGLETVREIGNDFAGKIIMISQVETKDLIGEAYSLGIEYYITKPINRLEVISVLNKVKERLLLEKSIQDIQTSINNLTNPNRFQEVKGQLYDRRDIHLSGKQILRELGIICESGYKDLIDILDMLYQREEGGQITVLKDLFEQVVIQRYGNCNNINKEIRSSEQRVRRAIHQSLEHIASLGLTDYSNPIFEKYAYTFFDFPQVRAKMLELEGKVDKSTTTSRVNIKKFLQAFYLEAKELE